MDLQSELKQLQRRRVERKDKNAPFVRELPERTDRPRPDARPIERLFEMGGTGQTQTTVRSPLKGNACSNLKINELRDFSWVGEPVTGVYIQAPIADQNNQSYIPYFLGPYHPNLGFRPTLAFWTLWCQTKRPVQQGDVLYLTTLGGERLGFTIRYVLRKGTLTQNEELYRKRSVYLLHKQGRKPDLVRYYKEASIEQAGPFQTQAVEFIQTWIDRCFSDLEKKFDLIFTDTDVIRQQLDFSFRYEGTVESYLQTALSVLVFLDPTTTAGKLSGIFQRRFSRGYYDPRDIRTRLFQDKCPEVALALTPSQVAILKGEWRAFSGVWIDEAVYQIYLSTDITRKTRKQSLPLFQSSLFSLFRPYQAWCAQVCGADQNAALEDLVVVQVNSNPEDLRCFNIKKLLDTKWDLELDPLDEKEKLPALISDTLFSLYPERDRVGWTPSVVNRVMNGSSEKKPAPLSQTFLAQTLLQRMHSDLDHSESYYAMHPYPTYYVSPKKQKVKETPTVCRPGNFKCCICAKLIPGSPIKSVQVLGDDEDEDKDIMIKKYCSGACFEKEEDWEPESEKEEEDDQGNETDSEEEEEE